MAVEGVCSEARECRLGPEAPLSRLASLATGIELQKHGTENPGQHQCRPVTACHDRLSLQAAIRLKPFCDN